MENDNRGQPNLKWWDDRAAISTEQSTANSYDESIFITPKTIYNYFDSQVYGLEDYKKKLSVAIWSALHRHTKTNFLCIGESGTGKSELARVLSKIYPNCAIYDSANCSPKAFRGNNTLTDALLEIDETKPSFVFIDEFDKCISKGSQVGSMMEAELLKMVEGAKVYVGEEKQRKLVDTSLVNFIFMGTFADVKKNRASGIGFNSSSEAPSKDTPITKDEIVESGALSNEFLGRMNGGIIQLPVMTTENAKAIITDIRYSPVSRLEKQYSVSINLSPNKVEELANLTQKYGVRGIYAELQEKICDALFENSETSTIEI